MTKIILNLHFEDGTNVTQELALPAIIGRSKQCDLILQSWRVAKEHSKIIARENQIWLEDLGSIMGTLVNGKRIASYGPIKPYDKIIIGNCLLQLQELLTENETSVYSENNIDQTTSLKPEFDLLLENPQVYVKADSHINNKAAQIDLSHRKRLHASLISALQLKRRDINEMTDSALRLETKEVLAKLIDGDVDLPAEINRQALLDQLLDEAVGLGPLEELLQDTSVTEIMVNRHDEIFVERAGQLQRSSTTFSSEQAVLGIIDRIVAPIGRRIDDGSPMVDARLKDGSRVNAVIAPLALRGACLTIRKFPQRRLLMEDLIKVGALDEFMAQFLNDCVNLKKNIVVSGGTGSGKTSLLNILSNAIPTTERIITIEDAAELRLNHEHQVNLESRPANTEGRGQIVIRDLVRNALRMRPDRIVVGECRGAEAFDMLSAMNTGHEGSLTTLHANSPRDALARLETMILMAGMDLPLTAIREHIASAIDIIVQLVRLSDGRRMISSIVQLTGLESGKILLQDLFLTKVGPPAVFSGCNLMPDGFNDKYGQSADIFNQTSIVHGKTIL